jgi:tripeptidyl-peptidase-1
VTAVGGTSLAGVFETGPEVAWAGSGGGFSNVFPMPAYQRAAVLGYLGRNKNQLPSSSLYNVSGRCYPDVAAFSTGFAVVADLIVQLVDGTSCATPTFSGVLALVNDARLAAGKPALGFLNPFLYANPGALNDITEGNNGFPCSAGFDPVTGLGSPLFQKLIALD